MSGNNPEGGEAVQAAYGAYMARAIEVAQAKQRRREEDERIAALPLWERVDFLTRQVEATRTFADTALSGTDLEPEERRRAAEVAAAVAPKGPVAVPQAPIGVPRASAERVTELPPHFSLAESARRIGVVDALLQQFSNELHLRF